MGTDSKLPQLRQNWHYGFCILLSFAVCVSVFPSLPNPAPSKARGKFIARNSLWSAPLDWERSRGGFDRCARAQWSLELCRAQVVERGV
jgi:hypothetical protein